MKRFLILLGVLLSGITVYGQDKPNYGNTPDKIVPYSNFQKAYVSFFDEPLPYRGSGRDTEAPKGLKSVRIGFLGPMQGSRDQNLGLHMLQGAQLALEEANAEGGYNGLPYELMIHNDVGLWGAAANTIVDMKEEGCWAILGSIDGTVTHVALRIALKLEIAMVNTGDSDPTLTETRIPWIMRNLGDDRQSSYALANEIYQKRGFKNVAVLRTNVRYGRGGVKEFSDASKRLGHPLLFELQFADGDTVFTEQLERIAKTPAEAVVIWANDQDAAHIVKQMREMGMTHAIFTSDRANSDEFLSIAGQHAEGIVTTSPYNPESGDPQLISFQKKYYQRFGEEPNSFSAHAYDGMNIIVKAIEKGGLNRIKIRDVLLDLKTFQGYDGVTGELVLDASWNDVGEIWMAEVKNGRFEYRETYQEMNQ